MEIEVCIKAYTFAALDLLIHTENQASTQTTIYNVFHHTMCVILCKNYYANILPTYFMCAILYIRKSSWKHFIYARLRWIYLLVRNGAVDFNNNNLSTSMTCLRKGEKKKNRPNCSRSCDRFFGSVFCFAVFDVFFFFSSLLVHIVIVCGLAALAHRKFSKNALLDWLWKYMIYCWSTSKEKQKLLHARQSR